MMFLRHGHTLRDDQVIVCLELRPSPEQTPRQFPSTEVKSVCTAL